MNPHLILAFLTVAEIFLLAFSIWGLGYLWETVQNGRPGRVIYHASNHREQGPLVCEAIRRYGVATERTDLIEPGAGMAVMSHYLARRFSWKSVRAIELGGYIQFLGRLRYAFARDGVRLVRHDLLTYDYPAGSVVYCYLFPSLMTALYEKGKLDGCLVISLTFAIAGCAPTEEMPLKSWQARLLIYDFRKGSGKRTAAAAIACGTGRRATAG